ncbi:MULTISPECIES: ABC transporter permease [unclassified Rhodococcus (in: high G+C Gram-positive bacteria)]|jgi:putative ABC transport system permease protein|uniref:ABC transporter permease n=1 Tax=unclassified Rhodococcus (in: high G+C Gram-positive bacteria) TaxID=192944 RepID=UPI00197E979B|nr:MULTISPECIES: ABC transporter permease [unclassified Rhodococcus (in: high G+C Gram-positive bacteria)]MBF0663675.1 ABC transporter permease [Rhodococcus sp. (in: high G+C Gram-positive bacteria)]
MFLAVRELVFARTRVLLMASVIALISVLMVILSGLSSGLVDDGVSGLQRTPAQAFAFQEGTKTDSAFSRSVVTEEQAAAWAAQPGVEHAELMGNAIVNAHTGGGMAIDLTLFGIVPGSFLEPTAGEGTQLSGPRDIILSETARDEGVAVGDTVTVDRLGTEMTVVGFTEDKRTFGHVDIAYVPLATWQEINAGTLEGAATEPRAYTEASVVAIQGTDGSLPDLAAGDAAAGTASKTVEESFDSSPGYSAETMTMSMIIAFLYAISALVVGAFFSIWTVQRLRELAVLRAMGASTGYLMRDSIIQAALILVVSVAFGVLVGLGLGSGLEGTGMPFSLQTGPILQGALLLIVLGLIGAGLAIVRITRINPLTALGENR